MFVLMKVSEYMLRIFTRRVFIAILILRFLNRLLNVLVRRKTRHTGSVGRTAHHRRITALTVQTSIRAAALRPYHQTAGNTRTRRRWSIHRGTVTILPEHGNVSVCTASNTSAGWYR